MSLFSQFFSPNGTPSTATGAQQGTNNALPPANSNNAAGDQQQQQQQQQQKEVTPTSSLDQFQGLWQTPTTSDGKPVAAQVPDLNAPIFNFDPAKIQETASKMNFTGHIAPETISKALGGDVDAFSAAINSAVQAAVVGLTMSQGNLINQAVAANNQRVTQVLPTQIKHAQLMDLPEDNPVYSHPAVQPLVSSLKQMAFAKNPQASPAEIAKQVSDYLAGLGTALHATSPAAQQQASAAKAGESDWSSFLPS